MTVARSDLSRLLFRKIGATTEVIFGDEVVALEEHSDGVMVEFKHAGRRRFDLMVGADGLHSNVRPLVFGPQSEFEKPLGNAAAAFEARGYRPRDENVYVMNNRPGRIVGRFVLRDDLTLFLFVFADDIALQPAQLALSAQKAILRERYGHGKWECPRILGELDRTQELYFDRISQIRMEAWSRGRVGLVGDAAFCVSLAAGQGSALAMTAAYVLAGELAQAQGRHDEAFARYEGSCAPT